MNFNAGQPAGDMRAETRYPVKSMLPDPVREAMENERMDARVGRNDLPVRARSRVTFEYDRNIFTQMIEHERL
jgi:hypothetical protein